MENHLHIRPGVFFNYSLVLTFFNILLSFQLSAQEAEPVKLVKSSHAKSVDIFIGPSLFTRFIYPDSLEKPVLFPIYSAGNTPITRGFPKEPRPGEPTDHPHHIGLWLTYENVNNIDFWNNSYAIPAEKKSSYGWIKVDRPPELTSGRTGTLTYHAGWVNQKGDILLEETTRYEFSGHSGERIINRETTLKAMVDISFTDAKDGMLGLRLAHELQVPASQDQFFTDDKGNKTLVKKDLVPTGNYLTSAGKQGDSAWGTRAAWCKVFGKMGSDSVSITIFDHPGNPNYPTFWHARGYGLFAANPLGEKVFTSGKSEFNLKLNKGQSVVFRYRILVQNGQTTPGRNYLDEMFVSLENEK